MCACLHIFILSQPRLADLTAIWFLSSVVFSALITLFPKLFFASHSHSNHFPVPSLPYLEGAPVLPLLLVDACVLKLRVDQTFSS